MLFNSITYLMFLPAVYLAYRVLPYRQQNIFLLIASYAFYAWWDIRFLFLIVMSTVVNYCCGLMIKNGEIALKERATASRWVILSFFLFVLIKWNYFVLPNERLVNYFDLGVIISATDGWIIFLSVCVLTLISNLLYSKLTLADEKKKRYLSLVIGISTNLIILGTFKYFNFFVENMEWLLKGVSLDPSRFHLNVVLPIGVSFYTFKGIAYVVDVYRGNVEPEHDYNNFALFIAFFPALLAGPIDRAKDLLPQISMVRKITQEQTIRGLHLIFYGLFKKVVIADSVVGTVNSVFGSTGQLVWIDVVVATLLFTLQIYCDFSGYTDVARGTAKLFGIDLMMNFKLPYFSLNPREFWSRWHISLSTWLRDYLYIPLGGNRYGPRRTHQNLILTMVLGGLWHGAAWNFVLWGLYHGVVISVHRAIGAAKSAVDTQANLLNRVIKTAFFFTLTCYGWLIFRAPSLEKVVALSSILIVDFGNFHFGAMRPRIAALFGLPIFLCIEIIENAANGKSFYKSLPIPVWTAIYASMIFALVIGMSSESAQFIYFNF
jgi:alginate O-acetyltransferase complex protein AlgI